MRILGISGSLRRDSHNTGLLRAAAGLLPPGGELVLLAREELKAVPPYDEDDDIEGAASPAVAALRDAIGGADAVLFATPEYNGSVPGQLKNAVDWASRPRATTVLQGKPVAVIGASTGAFGAVWAQAELRRVLEIAGARVIETELGIPHAQDGIQDDHRREIAAVLQALTDAVAPALAA